MCRSKRIKSIHSLGQSIDPVLTKVNIEGKVQQMEMDSGASYTVISKIMYRNLFSHIDIEPINSNLYTITGSIIKAVGEIPVTVQYGVHQHKLKLKIMEAVKEFIPLLGRDWLNVLIRTWRECFKSEEKPQVHNLDNKLENNIRSMYPNVFDQNQLIVDFKAEIQLKDSYIPKFHKPYNVPFKFREQVENEIDRLVKDKILQPVKFSEWASPIVIVKKPKSIRICIDGTVNVNKQINIDHYPIPKIDDIFAGLSKCTYFCVLDLKGAYQQLELTERSQEILTINTSKGLYKYLKLPFGVASAPSIFQCFIDQLLVNMSGVYCYLDDILIGAVHIIIVK